MNVLILGDGILVKEIIKQTGWDYISRKKDGFDITDTSTFKHILNVIEDNHAGIVGDKGKYNIIINCIANTDTYSTDKEKHWNVNYKGVANLVDFCNKYSIKLVHISTDYVYANSSGTPSENDIPVHQETYYAYTKLLADGYIELKSNNYLICRGTHKPKPFPYDKAWVDQVGNFDYVDVIASQIIKLINKDSKGVFNVGTEVKSIYILANKTKPDVMIEMAPDYIPKNTTMNVSKMEKELL